MNWYSNWYSFIAILRLTKSISPEGEGGLSSVSEIYELDYLPPMPVLRSDVTYVMDEEGKMHG
jgi:hypothetical protein